MVAKRKAISTIAKEAKATRGRKAKAVETEEQEQEEVDQQIVAVEEKEPSETELVAARTKELKAMSAEDLKALMTSNGLDTGKKEEMIKNLLKQEAKLRKAAREHKAKIRAVVIEKKQEFEKMSAPELTKLCDSMGLKGLKSKQEKVQRLLVQWQENDGVDKALTDVARAERSKELNDMEMPKLQKLCTKSGVDPYVTEIMVDRISRQEFESGLYARPVIAQESEAPKDESKGSLVDAVLANEAQRAKEKEVQAKKEQAALSKLKDLKNLSIDDLKKKLTKKGLEVTGKKEEMIKALFTALIEEDALAERKSALKDKSQPELKAILARNKLEATGSKQQLVDAIITFEAKQKQDLKSFETKINELVEKKKKELQSKTNAELKSMCSERGLAVGGGKEERMERIADKLREDPSLDRLVSAELRNKRIGDLMTMEKKQIVQMCDDMSIEPCSKEVMVERLLAHETEGCEAIIMQDAAPPAKKSRKQ